MANYREPQWLLPNEKNLQYPAAGATYGSGLTEDRHSLYSMDFNGSSYIDIGDLSTLSETTAVSVSLWFKKDGNGNYVLFELKEGSSKIALQSYLTNGLYIYINNISYNVSTTVANGEWHNIILVFDGSKSTNADKLKLYFNGSNITGGTYSGTVPTSVGAFTSSMTSNLGRTPTTAYFDGMMDEVAIFSRALSSDEIDTLWNNGSPSNPMLLSGKPVAYYPLGEQARKPGTANWRFPNEVLQGQAIDFDGSTDYIELPETKDLTFVNTNFSISIWLNPDVSHNGLVMQNYYGSNGWGVYYQSGSIRFYDAPVWTTLTTININEWTHILIVGDYTGSNLICYKNGGEVYNSSHTFSITDPNRPIFIGSERGTGFFFNGKLSNIALWNSDQSANIDNIYNYGAPQTSYTVTPTAWYKLDKTSRFTGLNPNWHSALSFNGSSNYVNLGSVDETEGITTMSISGWFRPSQAGVPGAAGIIAKESRDFYVGWYSAPANSIRFLISDDDGATQDSVNSESLGTNANVLGKWHHFVCTWDASDKLIIYINGAFSNETNSVNATSALPASTNTLEIGRRVTTYFNGQISNLAIYNQVISPEDVKYLYNGGTPQTNISFEPLSWYKLDNTGTGIQDSGSASNNGTNNGATEVASNVAVDEWVFENAVQSQTPNWSSALRFGGNNAIDLPAISFDMTNNLTLSCWINPANFQTWDYLCTRGSTGGVNSALNFRFSSSGQLFSHYVGGSAGTGVVFSRNEWSHLAITFNYSTGDVIFYKNGTQTGNTLSFASGYPTAELSNIGDANGTGSSGMDALISNFAIWESIQDVSELYNDGTPATSYTNTPTAWWKLDNTTTGIQDSGSSGNNGTNVGTTEIQTNVWTPRLNGESDTLPSTALVSSDLQFNSAYSSFSLDFDAASSDYINCTDNDIFSFGNGVTDTPFSISAWIYITGTTAQGIVAKYGSSTSTREWLFYTTGAKTRLLLMNSSGNNNYRTSSLSLSTNTWYHVAATYDGRGGNNAWQGINLYINGDLSNTNSVSTSYDAMSNTSQPVQIGTYQSSRFIDGKVDEVSVFNKELNQAEITSIYNNGYPKDITALTPISWWRLGEDAYFNGNDFIVPNQITGAPNGTSNGMPASALVADAPGSYAAGLGSSLVEVDRIGDAALSTANSLSFNMTPENRVSYPSGYVPTQVDNVYSMAFDGNDDYVDVGVISQVNSATACTLCYWGKKTASNKHLLFGSQIGLQNGIWLSWWSDGNVYFSPRNGGNTGAAYALSFDTNWHHFVGVYDGSSAKIYVDGNLVSTNTTSIPSSLSTDAGNDFNIGYLQSTYASGNMDEVAIFDYALSARQIKQDIYNGTTSGKTADLNNISNLTPPVAWYRMGD